MAAAGKRSSDDSERPARRQHAMLDAATAIFLRDGYLGASMDEIAARSGVSKQTVYKHFSSKEALFIEIVGRMTTSTGDTVRTEIDLEEGGDLARFLLDYALRQMHAVLTPEVMQLRRLVIGEVNRFPELARVLYERGPMRALNVLAGKFADLSTRGLLELADPMVAASHFNWLIMAHPLNEAMLLGDAAIPSPGELRRHAEAGVRVFLAAYGADGR